MKMKIEEIEQKSFGVIENLLTWERDNAKFLVFWRFLYFSPLPDSIYEIVTYEQGFVETNFGLFIFNQNAIFRNYFSPHKICFVGQFRIFRPFRNEGDDLSFARILKTKDKG